MKHSLKQAVDKPRFLKPSETLATAEPRANKAGPSGCMVRPGPPLSQSLSLSPPCQVGGGDSATEEAVYLTKYGKHVHLFVRGERMRASKAMQDRVLHNPKVPRPPPRVASWSPFQSRASGCERVSSSEGAGQRTTLGGR